MELSGRLILVIDDSAAYRAAIKSALESEGFRTIEAEDSERGLRLAARQRPAAIIVGGGLPGVDCAAVIRRVRLDSELRKTPCLLLTASDDREAEVLALDAGADAFAYKTQGLDLIVARVGPILRRRILAVDDDDIYLDTLADILRDEGYEVSTSRSGEHALARLKTESPDCILLDLVMSGIGGYETCKRIKANPALRAIPVVILTGMEDRRSMLDALAAGADDYVVKSTDPEVWRARVRALIRRKSFEDEARRAREEQMARELAATRAALLEDLKRKNKELEAFSYSVSHDLRAPLRAIDGFSRALEEDYAERLDETGREHLRRVRAAAARMRDLIDDLLRLSRISRAELRREGVDLSALAGTVIAALEKSGGERKVEFVIDPELNADADRRMLQVVLENLFGNAWKFTSKTAQPRIELGKKEQDGETIHFLRDNGVGFDMGHAGKLFAPFQRLHAEADFPGTGIGLATVYRIIDRHGGRIWAESSPGKGATFFFTLPPAKR